MLVFDKQIRLSIKNATFRHMSHPVARITSVVFCNARLN